MVHKVLVVYGTKYGATAEIAEKIGGTLQAAGIYADIVNAKDTIVLDHYTAVVLGSAVYIGSWRKDAVHFLEKNIERLSEIPVWLFSSGPAGEGDPVELLGGWHYPEKLKPEIEKVQPREIVVFHGNVDVEKMNFLEKFMISNVKSPTGDFRDWNAITNWAMGIASYLNT